jgi:hypothetical protein
MKGAFEGGGKLATKNQYSREGIFLVLRHEFPKHTDSFVR